LVCDLHELADMKSQETAAHGRPNGAAKIHWTETARRVKQVVAELPSNLGDRMKHDPYTTLGLVAAAGIGVGIVLGSRILRTALTSALSYAVVELARGYVRERIPAQGIHMPHVADATHAHS
jgi:hypothetical protein